MRTEDISLRQMRNNCHSSFFFFFGSSIRLWSDANPGSSTIAVRPRRENHSQTLLSRETRLYQTSLLHEKISPQTQDATF